MASGSFDYGAKIWDTASGKELLSLDAGQVHSVAFSPDGTRLASGSGHNIKIWDSTTGKGLIIIPGSASSVAFSPDGKRLASGHDVGTAGMVKIWDSATGKELLGLDALARVSSVTFSPDGKRLASGHNAGRVGMVKIWDSATGKERHCQRRKGNGIVRINIAFKKVSIAVSFGCQLPNEVPFAPCAPVDSNLQTIPEDRARIINKDEAAKRNSVPYLPVQRQLFAEFSEQPVAIGQGKHSSSVGKLHNRKLMSDPTSASQPEVDGNQTFPVLALLVVVLPLVGG